MSSQHWEPAPRRTGSHRRTSSDYEQFNTDKRYSADSQAPRRAARASVQTNFTDAPTETTFNPSSPGANSFTAQGLAPPSYQVPRDNDYHSDQRPAAVYIEDEQLDPRYVAEGMPPMAPDVPRGPPVSFRRPYLQPAANSRGQLPTRYVPPMAETMDQERMSPLASPTREASQWIGSQPSTRSPLIPERPGPVPSDMVSQARKPSTGGYSDRRKKLTDERSPLQRLELTLDSMTKEEKRARMQAAEQRARERASRKTSEDLTNNHVQLAQAQGTPSRQIPASYSEPAQETIPVTQRRPSTQDRNRQQLEPVIQPRRASESQPRVSIDEQPVTQAAEAPKRSLSFKDRAGRKGSVPSTAADVPNMVPARSGSNKLRKEMPAHLQAQHFGRHEKEDLRALEDTQQYSQPRKAPLDPSLRDKQLPPLPSAQYTGNDDPGAGASPLSRNAPLVGYEAPTTYAPTQREYMPGDGQAVPRTESQDVAAARRRLERQDSDNSSEDSHHHRVSNMLYKSPEHFRPGDGLYKPPQWLDEWKKGPVGFLSGGLLDVQDQAQPESYKAWWEEGGRRRSTSGSTRRRKAEAFDGEYDDVHGAPTRFKPALYLECGPLLRYCGLRREALPTRAQRSGLPPEREIWRGSMMIVTKDSESSYEIAPILRLFIQDLELLPAPPHQVNGELPAEYVDPIAGHPKLGRRGETLYVRPVDHLEESKDHSRDETSSGLFEAEPSPPDDPPADGSSEVPGSYASRRKRSRADGEKLQKYKDVRGFRLHAERGYTFWRFNMEIELREQQQRIAYRINRGPALGFWVPARGQTMNIMFHSCNGFSSSVKSDEFSGPDPMWRDVLNTHQTQPFHVMVGGGDQIYNDCVADECSLFDEWLSIRNPFNKHSAAFTPELQAQLEEFYLQRYCMWFSQGLFGLANSQIPMVNMYDDHDIFDGYGSYPHHDMKSPVFSGIGSVAFKYYMLFQHQSVVTETENTEPSWILGTSPGPYIKELSRSVYVSMGGKVALLAVDCRTERTEHDVIDDQTWEKITNRLYSEVRLGQVDHLLVLLGVPIAYPRLVWLENILTSRLFDPLKALGKTGVFGSAFNKIDGGAEVLDDLNDHWTAKNHKQERSVVIEDLQDLAMDKSVRVTMLSGDVHLAAIGQFYSNPQLGLAKHRDPRYMPNVISSAIVNAPPPDILADVLNKRHKVHHFDKHTDENMIPIFQHGVDGKSRNNKRLLPHRNWCSIRMWTPGTTPPPTPPMSSHDGSASPPPSSATGSGTGAIGLFRKLSRGKNNSSGRFDMSRESVRGPRPPVSGGGIFRSLTRRNSSGAAQIQPTPVTRTMSLGRDENKPKFFGFGRRGSASKPRPDDGDINGQWGDYSDEDDYSDRHGYPRPSGLRGGAMNDEFSVGDESQFSPAPPRRSHTLGSMPASRDNVYDDPRIKPFHRTPTGLSVKQMRKAEHLQVDLEGGLDVCLNVEVNPKDPTGITVPYRILVPRLDYKYKPEDEKLPVPQPSGFKRLLSFRKKQQLGPPQAMAPPPASGPTRPRGDYMEDDDDDYDDDASSLPPSRR